MGLSPAGPWRFLADDPQMTAILGMEAAPGEVKVGTMVSFSRQCRRMVVGFRSPNCLVEAVVITKAHRHRAGPCPPVKIVVSIPSSNKGGWVIPAEQGRSYDWAPKSDGVRVEPLEANAVYVGTRESTDQECYKGYKGVT